MKTTTGFCPEKYDKGEKIIIYGASSYGELAFWGLKQNGLSPDYFRDRAVIKDKYMGIPVIRPREVEKFKDDYIIIASADYFHEIKNHLEKKGMQHIYDLEYLLLDTEIEIDKLTKRARDIFMNKSNYIDVIYQNQGINNINFTRIQYVVSERCSLRCRDCTHLMQFYQHPQNINLDSYKDSFDKLLSVTDSISEMRILGGDSHPHST